MVLPMNIHQNQSLGAECRLRRYFLSQGLTFYSWTSDQFAQYGTKVVPATIRDATYVLDAILDNTTELSLVEHTTDTAGYTEIVFALFDPTLSSPTREKCDIVDRPHPQTSVGW